MNALQFLCFLAVFNVLSCVYGIAVEFFEKEDFEDEMFHVASSENCTNLPTGAQTLKGSITTTKCIAIYWNRDCHDEDLAFVIRTEEKRLTEQFSNIEDENKRIVSIKSIGICNDLKQARKRRTVTPYYNNLEYKATVFHIEINHNDYGNLKGRSKPFVVYPPCTTKNPSLETVTKPNWIRWKFTESSQFQWYYVLSKMSSIEFESQALKQFESSLSWIPYSFSKPTMQLKAGLAKAFLRGSPNLYKDKPLYRVETNEYFVTYQTFEIPKCKRYVGEMQGEFMHKVQIHYTCRLKITAKYRNTQKKLSSVEIKRNLGSDVNFPYKFLDGDSNWDEFTAVVEEPAWFTPEYVSNVIFKLKTWGLIECPNCALSCDNQ